MGAATKERLQAFLSHLRTNVTERLRHGYNAQAFISGLGKVQVKPKNI